MGTANKYIAQKLHFDFLESGATATFALALAGVKTESTGIQATLLSRLRLSKDLSNIIKCPDIYRRIGARSFGEDRLVDQDNATETLASRQRDRVARLGGSIDLLLIAGIQQTICGFQFRGFRAKPGRKGGQEDLPHKGGLAGTADASHTDKSSQGDFDGKITQIMQRGMSK